ncbi:hypothetical protein AAFF_G00197070 [Aldrovandia affinis]|uniref:Uncharacterized protein n=1 Tax=Aldrovandia affinis TaxID=143900 RepID=A0AAD7W6Q3_9TELE|nr:hypothetical protein AAFF_G00197070 [Aldrovandia affinis]
MNSRWQDYIANNVVLEKAQMHSMESILLLQQLRWTGHVSCMEEARIPNAVFYSGLCHGKRKKHFKDQLKKQVTGGRERGGQTRCSHSHTVSKRRSNREKWTSEIKHNSVARHTTQIS